MNTVDKQYQGFLRKLLMYGNEKGDRTGTGTLSYFGDTFRHNMEDGFPLLTTKKMAFKTMMEELKWFLKGKNSTSWIFLSRNFLQYFQLLNPGMTFLESGRFSICMSCKMLQF